VHIPEEDGPGEIEPAGEDAETLYHYRACVAPAEAIRTHEGKP